MFQYGSKIKHFVYFYGDNLDTTTSTYLFVDRTTNLIGDLSSLNVCNSQTKIRQENID